MLLPAFNEWGLLANITGRREDTETHPCGSEAMTY
jgi:hypothetical protein